MVFFCCLCSFCELPTMSHFRCFSYLWGYNYFSCHSAILDCNHWLQSYRRLGKNTGLPKVKRTVSPAPHLICGAFARQSVRDCWIETSLWRRWNPRGFGFVVLELSLFHRAFSFFPSLLFTSNRFHRPLHFGGKLKLATSVATWTSVQVEVPQLCFNSEVVVILSDVTKTLGGPCLASYLSKLIWMKMDTLPPLEFSNVFKLNVTSGLSVPILSLGLKR